jgi:hypothetical protein
VKGGAHFGRPRYIRVVAQAERIKRARPVVLHEHVGGRDQFFQDVAIPRLFEIECDRAFVGGLRQEGRAHIAAVEFLIGACAAALVGIVWMLDLDHVGAQHGQLIGGERPGKHMGDVDHPDPFERPHANLPRPMGPA